VLDGCSAQLILVVGRAPGTAGIEGLSLFAVAADAPGLTRRPLQTLDPTRKQAALTFRDTPATLLGVAGEAAAGLQRALDLGAIALANEMMGGAQQLLEDTLAFTRMRMQFGRPIASFQAIKHRATDMLLAVELAKSGAYYAAAAADDDDPELPVLASLAKAAASEAYLHTAIEAIQLHGGIGFTWDQDTHLWFKRAKSSEVLLGDPPWHRERMIRETLRREAGNEWNPQREHSA
jgi:alkylation response protein AidB-like acyl-CoA dehydrogenase